MHIDALYFLMYTGAQPSFPSWLQVIQYIIRYSCGFKHVDIYPYSMLLGEVINYNQCNLKPKFGILVDSNTTFTSVTLVWEGVLMTSAIKSCKDDKIDVFAEVLQYW